MKNSNLKENFGQNKIVNKSNNKKLNNKNIKVISNTVNEKDNFLNKKRKNINKLLNNDLNEESLKLEKKVKQKNKLNYIEGDNQKKREKIKFDDSQSIQILKDLTNDSYINIDLDNTFCTFKSIYDIFYLVYSNKNKSIIFYNLIDFKKINEIKKAHNKYIINFRHYLDKINKRDLMISISKDNNIKLWNINNYECLYIYQNVNKNGDIYSSCFLNDKVQTYIITSNYTEKTYPDPIKVFDFNGNKIKKINKSNELTVFIDTYYDKKKSKIFIITGNFDFARSFDYEKNRIYHRYFDYVDYSSNIRFSLTIYKEEEIIKLIESSLDGNIRIWNFHSGELLNKIKVCKYLLSYGICLWNYEFLFVGCEDGTISLLNLKNKQIINNFDSEDNKKLLSIKTFIHPIYGNCLISQSNQIKLWINKI